MRNTRSDRLLGRLAAVSLARPKQMLLIGLALFVVSLPGAVRLFADLRTDLRELLPQGAPAAVALDELERRVGGLAILSVVVETNDLAEGERFVDLLGQRLRPIVPALAREVRWKIDEERAFLDAHGALFADAAELERLRDELHDEVQRAKQKANPFFVDLDSEPANDEKPTRELQDTLRRLREREGRYDHFIDGYLAGEEGHTLALIVVPADAAVSLDRNLRLFHAVEREVQALKRSHPSLRVGYTGEVAEVIEAQDHLVRDLAASSVIVLLATAAVIILYYRSLRALPLLAGPLFTGVVVTFGLSRLAIGYLNPNTAFLGNIIVGNGINGGIILLARYLEERRRGLRLDEALPVALTSTWRATLTAGAAAAASYASLGATGFRGFSQFAFIGGVGMVVIWLATYLFMPPLIVFFERLPRRGASRWRSVQGRLGGVFSGALLRLSMPALLLCAAITVASVAWLLHFSRDPIEYDFSKLRSRQGDVNGTAFWSRHLDAVMQTYQTPTVVLTDDPAQAAAVAEALRAEKRAQGAASLIDTIQTQADLVPADQVHKLALLGEIFDLLDKNQLIERLPEEDRSLVERLRGRTVLRPVTLDDVPARLSRIFREKDGQRGRIVLVYPTLGATSAHGREQLAFARLVREAVRRTEPHALVAGQLILAADIVQAITGDGAVAASLSFAMVALLTVLVLGSLRDGVWVLASLVVGTLWMGGAFGALDLKLNFVNFVVLPITFGIGVDYAVNLYQRYRQSGRDGLAEALGSSGGAVALCSATTIIGYAALLIADNRAVFSFGLTAVIGELTCLTAALVGLPAVLSLMHRRHVEAAPVEVSSVTDSSAG